MARTITSPPPPPDLLGWYPLHLGCWGAWPRVELVDEQRWKLVLATEVKGLLKVLLGLSGKAADDVCCYGDPRHSRLCDR